MATKTYNALLTTTVQTAVPSVTLNLSGIINYTDLRVVINGGSSSSAANVLMRYNNDSTSGFYSTTDLTANGSAPSSHRTANSNQILCNYFGYMDTAYSTNIIIDIFQYANPNVNKTNLTRANNPANGLAATVGLWRNTAPITSITFFTGAGNFSTGSTFTIYGIANADTFTKATGGIISEDSTYTYHVFGASGTFTPKQALTADILVVAGGGAGGAQGGGGGAGGLVYSSSVSLASGTTYTATVGSGGAAVSGVPGSDGVSSSLAGTGLTTISATGGGGGGSGNSGQNNNGRNGGSGGGAGIGPSGTGGTAVSGQGNAGGGAPGGGGNYPGGGGGGAAAAGGTPATNTSPAGNGGNGSSSYDAWGKATTMGEIVNGTYYFAGGGGGGIFYNAAPDGTAGLGGYGGGTAGKGQNIVVSNAKANTGGGGGGVGHPTLTLAGNGGSGIVIVRYPK